MSDYIASSDSKCDGSIKCKVCDSSFESLDSFLSHSVTREHALKVMQAESNGIPPSSSAINNIGSIATTCRVSSTYKDCIVPELNDKSSNVSYGNCSVCSKMFSGPEPYKQHLESQAHKKKVALLQNPANLGEALKCEPCNKSFSGQVPYAQHMSSETHKKKMQNIEIRGKYLSGTGSSNSQAAENEIEKINENKQWFCNICNKQCNGWTPYQQHLEGSIHFKNVQRAQGQTNFVKMDHDMASMMQTSNSNESKISEKSENIQELVNVNYPNDNGERKNDLENMDSSLTSIMQVSKPNGVKQSGNYQTEKGGKENDFLHLDKEHESEIFQEQGLPELMKVLSPDKTIDFDELYMSN